MSGATLKRGWLLFFAGAMVGCSTYHGLYPYHITTGHCFCERFETKDNGVSYVFAAAYEVDNVIRTRITVDIVNRSRDTLDLSLAHVKVFSRNVPYRYNDKFIPIDIPFVPPGGKRTLTLTGESVTRDDDPWLKIPGEEMVVTLKGMRMQMKTLRTIEVSFVPQNPRLGTSIDESGSARPSSS